MPRCTNGLDKLCLRGHDDQVAGQHQARARARGRALDGGHHGLVAVQDRRDQPLPALLQHPRDVAGRFAAAPAAASDDCRRQSRAGAEVPRTRRSQAAPPAPRGRQFACSNASVSASRAKGDNEFPDIRPVDGDALQTPSSPTETSIPGCFFGHLLHPCVNGVSAFRVS